MSFPATHVVAAGDDVWTNSFRDPRMNHKITDFSFHSHQITRPHLEPLRMRRMHPKGIRVGDFVKPFRIGAARVNLHREAESGDQDHLITLEIVGMHMTLDVSRQRIYRPAP